MRALLCAAVLLAVFGASTGSESSNHYTLGEDVVVWLNKVGPYHNPSESYSYYTLPFCAPANALEPRTKMAGLGELLDGTEFVNSDLVVPFGRDVPSSPVCSMQLTEETAEFFAFTVSNHYWYQMYIDGLPVWGMVGEIVATEETIRLIEQDTDRPHAIADHTYLFTHKRFSFAYNGDQIIEANMTSENPSEIVAGRVYDMTYSVEWVPTTKSFENRFGRYLEYSFFEHQIHWFSLINSFMMVVFLCGLVALILMRTLKQDYAKYLRDEDDLDGLDKGMGDDSGWKQVHGEVFRRPPYLMLFSALIGTGYQLAVFVLLVILASIASTLYLDHSGLTGTTVFIYALTSVVAGYTSGAYYRSHYYPDPSPDWIRAMFLTASLLPGIAFATLLGLNFVSLSYGTINSIPFSVLMLTVLSWAFVSLPLVIGGTIVGRRWSGKASFPCRVNSIPRPIPPRKWYTHPALVCLLTGILPFGSIFIEMYFVFTSFWNYKFYFLYGFMLLVYLILAIVTSCVTIVAVYFFLNSEDYRWPWLSFLSSASTSVYVFLYSVYYFFFKTSMTGFLQTMYYFSYMGLFCLAIGVLCGTIGVCTSSIFVRNIYQQIKAD